MTSDLVTARHLCRKAVIYIRQSTPHQGKRSSDALLQRPSWRWLSCHKA
jgi:hypothetical protein